MTEATTVLDELLSDPIVQLVMARDRVRPEELRRLLERARRRADQLSLPPHVIAARADKRMCA
jgi:hypothetical protein